MTVKQQVLEIIQDEIDGIRSNHPFTHDDEVKVDKLTDVYSEIDNLIKEDTYADFIQKFWKIINDNLEYRDMLTFAEIQMIFDSLTGNNRYKLIPAWRDKKLRCGFCGDTRSVKYAKDVCVPIKDKIEMKICLCNKCAARYTFIKLLEE